MTAIRFLLVLSLAALGACQPPDPSAPTTPAVPMPQVEAAMANSTPGAASRGMSNKTWLWTRGQGPAEIHYSAADGRDFVWLVGERRIFAGEWRIETGPDPSGQASQLTQICLRYPGTQTRGLLGERWNCRPAGTFFLEMAERESGDPLRFAGRTTAQVVLDKTPTSLAEVQARVR